MKFFMCKNIVKIRKFFNKITKATLRNAEMIIEMVTKNDLFAK